MEGKPCILYVFHSWDNNKSIFLSLTNKIINLSDGIKNNTIIEIGPGPGSLTRSIFLNGAKKVIAIEKDKRFVEALKVLNIATNNRLFIENYVVI